MPLPTPPPEVSSFWFLPNTTCAVTCVSLSPCLSSAVPSAPLSVISSVNETSVSLEWAEPRDSGGRSDLVYNVVCKKCEHGACVRCDDNVEVAPRRLGLAERHAAVRNLQAHTHYSFEIQAVNGVSPKSPITPHYATVNITTNQAGEDQRATGLLAKARGMT